MLHELARFKQRGWPFEQAWDRAWRSIRWPDKREARDEWKEVVRSGRSVWAACYQDEGAPIDITALIEAMGKETLREDAAILV